MNNANMTNDEPRGCFQVFAERKYVQEDGYRAFRGAFHSLKAAQLFAESLAANTDYYTGYAWAQVADVFHGEVWDLEGGEWSQVQTVGVV